MCFGRGSSKRDALIQQAAGKGGLTATPEEQAEARAAQSANLQIATTRRNRRRSSLYAGGRFVIGAPAGRGAAAGSGSGRASSSLGGGAGAPRSAPTTPDTAMYPTAYNTLA
jgi:hypothetical protein